MHVPPMVIVATSPINGRLSTDPALANSIHTLFSASRDIDKHYHSMIMYLNYYARW
jgi:hypothetical protein